MPSLSDFRVVRTITVTAKAEGVEQTTTALQGLSAAQDNVAASADRAATVTETSARRQTSVAGSYDRLRAQLDTVYRAQQQLERGTTLVDRAFSQGLSSISEREAMLGRLQARYESVSRASEQAAARSASLVWGRSTMSGSGVPLIRAQTGGEGAGGTDRYRDQLMNDVLFQGKDFIESIVSGGSPVRAALQQGPQVATLMKMGGFGAGDILTKVGGAASSLLTPVGAAAGAFGGLAAALALVSKAGADYATNMDHVERSLLGIGRASGQTTGSIERQALSMSPTSGLSTSSARDVLATFASTGRIGTEIGGRLANVTRDYANATGQSISDANRDLASSFANISTGATSLADKIGGISDSTIETAKHLDAMGDRLGAQRLLFSSLSTNLTSYREQLTSLGRLYDDAKTSIGSFYDAMGRGVGQKLGFDPIGEQLERVKADLASLGDSDSKFDIFGVGGRARNALEAERDRLSALVDKQNAASRATEREERGRTVGGIVRGLNPDTENLKRVEDQARNIKSFLDDGGIDKDGSSRRAMDALYSQARRMRDEMAAGGSAFAEAVRNAQFSLRTTGYGPSALALAQNNKQAEDDRRKIELDNLNPEERRSQLDAVEQRRSLEEQRIRLSATNSSASLGGAFSRAPADVQSMILKAVGETGISQDILASIGEVENGFRSAGYSRSLGSDGRPSSAYGFGQLTNAAAAEVGVNKFDPYENILGTARYFMLQRQRFGGDDALALSAYNQGAGNARSTEGYGYAAKVLRGAGQMGDASTLGQVQTLDANARALESQNRLVDINTQYLGRNGERLDAESRAQQLLADAQARGIPLSQALREEFDRTASGMASAVRRLSIVKFGDDLGFERDQLGRSSNEQAIYSRVRSTFGDTDTPAARMALDQARLNDNLKTGKDLASDFGKGLAQDLASGRAPLEALHNALTRLETKLIDMAMDQLVSKAFGGLISGSGSPGSPDLGGFLLKGVSGIFGLGSTPASPSGSAPLVDGTTMWHAAGGLIRGPGTGTSDSIPAMLSDGEFVIRSDVARQNLSLLTALNSGQRRGYKDGGPAGMPMLPAPMMRTAPPIVVNHTVVNQTGAQVETKESRGPNGQINMETTIRAIEGSLAKRAGRGQGGLAKLSGGANPAFLAG